MYSRVEEYFKLSSKDEKLELDSLLRNFSNTLFTPILHLHTKYVQTH